MFPLLIGPQLLISLAILSLRRRFPWLSGLLDMFVSKPVNDEPEPDTEVDDGGFFRVGDDAPTPPTFVLRYRRPGTYDRDDVLRHAAKQGVFVVSTSPRMIVVQTEHARAQELANNLGPGWLLMSSGEGSATTPAPPVTHPAPLADPMDEHVTVIAKLRRPGLHVPTVAEGNTREEWIAQQEAAMAEILRTTDQFLAANNLRRQGGGALTSMAVIEGRRLDIAKLRELQTIVELIDDTPLRRV